MYHQPIVAPDVGGARHRDTVRVDLLLAFAFAALLSFSWAVHDWTALSQLILPDADDMMRLAQVRDWLAGQATNDWTQYRMAPPLGSPMHWSRVNDVGIAGLILAATPFVGRHAAELVAVLGYPALLFAAHLFLSARIARRLWGAPAALIAVALGAMAYPGTTVFAPGRIDHHALQVVLIEIAVLAATARASLRSGLIVGGAIALSLVIGLETIPPLAGLGGVLFAFWVVRGERERARLIGVGAGLAATTLPFVVLLRPTLWSPAMCDAFTPASSNATFAGAAMLALLGWAGARLPGWRSRLAAGAALGALVLAGIVTTYPACLAGPYGQMDPFLIREFIPHIDEANGIFRQASIGRTLQLGGLMFAGVAGVAWLVWRRRDDWVRWAPLASVVAVCGLLMLVQVRGTYVGAPLSASLLAGVVLAARERRPARPAMLVAAWLACSGMGWYGAPVLMETAISRSHTSAVAYLTPVPPRALCNTPAAWSSMDRYPPGVVMAPVSIAAYLVGATRMSTVGAGYHRNNRGNMAMYRYFLSPPERAAGIARAWRVRYVAFCPADFAEMDVARRFPGSLAAKLDAGQVPAGFQQLPLRGTRLRFYRLAS